MMKRRVRKRNGIVCRTMYILCIYLCHNCSVPLVTYFLHIVTYLSSYYSCLITDAKSVAICEAFYNGNDLLMSLHFKMRFELFDCKCMSSKHTLKILCMHIISYSFFRLS